MKVCAVEGAGEETSELVNELVKRATVMSLRCALRTTPTMTLKSVLHIAHVRYSPR